MSGKVSDNIGRSSGSITEPSGGVEILSSDPTLTEGLVWYNSTSNVLKVARLVSGWSTENNTLSTNQATTGAGTVAAGLVFGGAGPVNETEEWDGTSWYTSGVGNLAVAVRDSGGFGIQTAAVSFGGSNGSRVATSEEYNGSAWGAGGALNESVSQTDGCGTLTAGMRCGGELA
jgi:hypothetical protein